MKSESETKIKMITAILILIIISGAAHSAPKTTKTHILCPVPECPGLIEHYRHLGWVRKQKKNKKNRKKTTRNRQNKTTVGHNGSDNRIIEVIVAQKI